VLIIVYYFNNQTNINIIETIKFYSRHIKNETEQIWLREGSDTTCKNSKYNQMLINNKISSGMNNYINTSSHALLKPIKELYSNKISSKTKQKY
jgi:hypothetical protein